MDYYISFGSNICPEENIGKMLELLAKEDNIEVVKVSKIYITEPWGMTEQAVFHNGALKITSPLVPEDMLRRLQAIEEVLGRVRLIKWGPRTIDLDIIWMEAEGMVKTCSLPQLEVPHPYFWERSFVLEPLRDIYPDFKYKDLDLNSRLEELNN